MMNPDEREVALAKMQDQASRFYYEAITIGNHPWIEFSGLLNEYLKVATAAHLKGIDFTECNTHSGTDLPMADFQIGYVNEKLECIFTGRSVMAVAKEPVLPVKQKVKRSVVDKL